MEIWEWMRALKDKVEDTFGDRIVCLGLQGSYARGEATENSDIDAVLILDSVSMTDLRTYREILKRLPHRERVCGFVSGKRELERWDRADLFQFCRDTQVILGSLDFAKGLVRDEDARRAVHIGACNLYHAVVHTTMHNPEMKMMAELYKSAFFLIRTYYYAENGVYINTHRELAECLNGGQRQLVYDAMALRDGVEPESFDVLAERLMKFASELIARYGE